MLLGAKSTLNASHAAVVVWRGRKEGLGWIWTEPHTKSRSWPPSLPAGLVQMDCRQPPLDATEALTGGGGGVSHLGRGLLQWVSFPSRVLPAYPSMP